jgi:hypothetical protein
MSDVVASVVDRFRNAALGLCGWDEALGLIGQAAGSQMMELGGLRLADREMVLNHTCGISVDKMSAFRCAGLRPRYQPPDPPPFAFHPLPMLHR